MDQRWSIGLIQEEKSKKEITFTCNDEEFMKQFGEVLHRFYRVYDGEIKFKEEN